MKIIADLHTHTLASTHAFSTIAEIATEAGKMGLFAVAITDHAPAIPDSPHVWHFRTLPRLQNVINGVRVLCGAELNVLPDYSIDLTESTIKDLDFTIASMHNDVFPPQKDHTEAWLCMANSPLVDCLGHCGRKKYPFDIETVAKECAKTETLIEINEGSYIARPGSEMQCIEIAKACKKYGVRISVNTDAHSAYEIGITPKSLAMLETIEFPEELVVNSSIERLRAYFSNRKRKIVEI